MRGLFNQQGRPEVHAGEQLFQSALRMRGLFNVASHMIPAGEGRVSIRLADAWPFQRRRSRQHAAAVAVSIRLADAWPFQREEGRSGGGEPFRFNPPCGCVAFSTRLLAGQTPKEVAVSIRLADAWPFQLESPDSRPTPFMRFNPPCGCVAFSTSSIRRGSCP